MDAHRRRLIAAAPAALAACSSGPGSHAAVAQQTWRHGPLQGLHGRALQMELVRYATLAASSHNTQCWRFALDASAIRILPDTARRCPAVDPDDHHLFVSLGCAAENLVQAAAAHGLAAQARFDADQDTVRVELTPAPPAATALFQAIPVRQSTRGLYDGQPLAPGELALLERAAHAERVQLLLLTGQSAIENVLAYVVQGNTAQLHDPAFMAELKAWIRFSGAEAVRQGDGLFTASSGNPAMPTWLGRLAFDVFFTPDADNARYARQLRSSAGVAVFAGQDNGKADWVEVGRACQRFALQAAALDIRTAFVNQPVEVAALRAPFAASLGLGARRPDLVLRFGRGPRLPPSLRRPVQAVLV